MNDNNHTTAPLPPPPSAAPQQPPPQQQTQQQQQPPQQRQAGILYDMSSFDPLQAQALQLTASAGLTGLLAGQQAAAGTALTQQQQSAGATGAPQPAPQQPQLFLLQPQALQQQQAAAAVPGTASATGQAQPTIQPLLAPAGATTNAQALLLPALVNQFPQQLLAAQGLAIPQQYLDAANASAAAPIQALSQQQQQQIVSLVASTAASNNSLKREAQSVGGDSNKKLKQQPLAPSMVSSSTNGTKLAAVNPALLGAASVVAGPAAASAASAFAANDPPPPKEASQADLSKMTPAERRRYERNLREQQRSYRISQQIKELRDILVDSKFPFKPNKYSILLSVVDYIKQLQSRAIMLDTEHSKLIKTIRETNNMMNTGNAPTSTDGESETFNAASTTESGSDSDLLFVKGIDYRSVFDQCPAALGIAALDGRILECNTEFQTLLGFPDREDVLKQSLFNLVQNHQDIFRAMAQMLKTAEEPSSSALSPLEGGPIRIPNTDADGNAVEGGQAVIPADTNDGAPVESVAISRDRFWTGPVTSKLNVKVSADCVRT